MDWSLENLRFERRRARSMLASEAPGVYRHHGLCCVPPWCPDVCLPTLRTHRMVFRGMLYFCL